MKPTLKLALLLPVPALMAAATLLIPETGTSQPAPKGPHFVRGTVVVTTGRAPTFTAVVAPGKEILHPVAIVIFGGLITSTLLDTILTPILFLRYGARPLERLDAVEAELKTSEAY